ncbi:hypothetical protein LLG46_15760 [bacterium]|nr:hypothetical protein [bacterium]
MSPHFLLHSYCDLPVEAVVDQTFIDALEQMHVELTAFLSLSTHTKHERISLKTTFTCFIVQINASRQFGSICSPNVLFYVMNPIVAPLHSEFHMLRFRHELTHLLWGQAYGEAPPLFMEGLAEYAGYLGAADELKLPVMATLTEVPPLADIAIADDYWKHGGVALYRASGAWVQYLVERWGWEKLKQLFLLTEYTDTQIQDHFAQVYAQKLETVEADWRNHILK